MSVDIAELGLRVRSDGVVVATERLRKLKDQARQSATATDKLTRAAEKSAKAMQKVGRNLTMYVTAPITAFGLASVKAFSNFDDAMTASMAIMGDLSDTMKKDMVAAARKMGKESTFSAKQAAESYYFLASAGLDAAASIAALPKVAAFAQAGTFDMAKATDILTDAQSALGLVVKDTVKNTENMVALSDVLVKANTIANASVQQFGEALTNKAASAMKLLNIEVETGVAVLAAWADQGVKSMEAGEKFNIVTRDLQTAFRNNAKEFEKFNIAVFENGAIRNMADIIGDIERALKPMSVELQGNTLKMLGFQDRSVIAIKSLIGLSEKIRGYEKDLRKAGGITQEVADKQMESFKNQVAKAKKEIADLGIEIGAMLAPHIISLSEDVGELVRAFRALDEETQKQILKWTALAALLGPALLVLGMMAKAVAFLAAAFTAHLLPVLVTLARLMSPHLAIIGGFTWLIDKLGNDYVESIEKATASTVKFTGSLRTMRDALTMESDIIAIGDNLDPLFTELEGRLGAIAELNRLRGDPNTPAAERSLAIAMLEKEQQTVADLRAEIDSLIRLRDRDTEALSALTLALQEEQAALENTGEAAGDLGETIATVAADGMGDEAFQAFLQTMADIEAEVMPAAAAMKELGAVRKMLDRAFASGKIDAKVFEQLNNLLDLRGAMLNMKEFSVATQSALDESIAYIEGLEALESQVEAIENRLDPAGEALRQFAEMQELVNEAFEKGAIDPERYEAVTKAIEKAANATGFLSDAMIDGINQWIVAARDMAGMFDQDSQEAKDLHRMITLLNVVMGINAVIKQLQGGDVYSAIPRAIAVASMIASMGVATGASGAASQSISERRQEEQGAGSVLGDAMEKTESILNATEITANATSELVGINRGMLHALQAMQAGIAGATNSIARGAGFDPTMPNTDFDGAAWALGGAGAIAGAVFGGAMGGIMFGKIGLLIAGPLGALIGGALGWALGKLLGGSSKVIDEGVAILGGNLQDAINGELVQAFATIKFKKWRWGSTRRRDVYAPLEDEASRQIGLVFQAIGDTVYQGALALGMSAEEIEAAMATFEIAATNISFEGLTAEEQQKELEAVFGKIFDDLAAHVIPYLAEFQQVGEGLGETLVRVATSVQVFQEAVKALGFAADVSDPKAFAEMAVGLVELTGGVENFIAQFSTFFDTFASDEQKLDFVTSQLSRAFESVGLVIPETRDGMIDLMHSLDASTEAGRAQIAMLLELTGVADEYYSLVESEEEKRLAAIREAEEAAREWAEYMESQRAVLDAFTGVAKNSALAQLEQDFDDAMKAAKALGASQREYAMIVRAFNVQLTRMIAEMKLSVISLAEQLFGSDGAGGAIEDGFEATRTVANAVFEDWQRALEDIYEFTQSILLDEGLTTLTPREQLAEAQSQFDRTLSAALGGDVEAAAALPDAAKALLEEARFMYASGAEYTKIFESVLRSLDRVKMPSGIEATIEVENERANYELQGEIIGNSIADELEKFLLAWELAEGLRHLAETTGSSVLELADELGIPLEGLIEAMGVDLENFGDKTAIELKAIADVLGIGFMELIDKLGIGFDLVLKYADINLDQPWKIVQRELIAFAETFGISLKTLMMELGIKHPGNFKTPREKDKYYDTYKKGFATGGYVGQTGMHQLHAGEFVINRSANNVSPAPTNELTQDELAQIRLVLTDIRDQQRRYQEADLESSRQMESSLKQQAEQQRRIANG
jgi:TP901 family phage tail tape measure protein